MMNNLWLKFGCFLTGYNYTLIRNSSEASIMSVKKYLSALIIVSILWVFIGFSFSQRYVHTGFWGSLAVSLIMLIIVIQIERQIILSTGRSNMALIFRSIIAVVMAVVGSVIIDQVIFKEDIEKQKISQVQNEVDKILSIKTAQIDAEIISLDSMLKKKEYERVSVIDEVTRKPFVKGSTSERKSHVIKITKTDGSLGDSIITRTDLTLTDIPNPKAELIPAIDQQIEDIRAQITEKQKSRLNIRENLEKEIKSRTGFLDELKTLMAVLT
ncbi:MAG: DUF4407 domain-containing protein, partial [Bacteroidales bacterium]|nr:DUF4407 domain-containing protein [Bacteroidales bacterium]